MQKLIVGMRRRWHDSLHRRMVVELWRMEPGFSLLVALCVVVSSLIPVGSLLVTGAIVGGLGPAVDAGSGSGAAHHVEILVGLLAALLVVQQVVSGVQEALVPSLARRFECALRERVMASAMAPSGVSHLQDPDIVREMSSATTVGTAVFGPGLAVFAMPVMVGTLITGFGMAVVLGAFRWWIAVLLAVAWLWAREMRRRDVVEQTRELFSPPAGTRRQAYFRDLTMTPDAAKEIRVFGLSGWVVDNFRRHWLDAMQQVWKNRRERRPPILGGLLFLVAANVLAFWVIGDAAANGDLGVGRLVIVLQAAIGIAILADPGGITLWDMVYTHGAATVAGVGRLEAALGVLPPLSPRTERPPTVGDVDFTGVTFRYAGSGRDVLHGLDLQLPAGRSVAIVGENGAGKTTLVRLLCGLVEPTDGAITVGGLPLESLDVDAWRTRLAVVFQDFTHFMANARDNVALGAVDVSVADAELDAIAERAGLVDVVDALAARWDTPLSRQLTDGTDLSGGQWQRVALARALLSVQAGASLLVLDEPTANLDVRGEAAFYERFLELTAGITTLIISHRYATVRRADVICVLDHGRIVESGSHDELMTRDGHYARLFRLQAASFDPIEEEAQ